MAQVPVLYQETRLSIPSSKPLALHSSGRSSAGRKRAFDEITGLDEETYARKHLATDGSVFFRGKARSPRSFLWRVLDDRKLLEIQCVDIIQKNHNEPQDHFTFRIEFDDPLREHGVAFADPEDTDALEIFALTHRNELHTITLRRDILARSSPPADFDSSKHIKRYSSNSLSFRTPYRLFAASSLELYISLNDGGFLRLERKANESGQQWKETPYNDGGLIGTLRGLNPLKRRQTVKHGSLELEPNSLMSMIKSPDGKHLWTVGLDHTLRAWSTSTWKQVHASDLLNEDADEDAPRKKRQYTMGGEVGTVLQAVAAPSSRSKKSLAKRGHAEYYLIVNSPKNHELKIFGVNSTSSSIEELSESPELTALPTPAKLIPPIDELLKTNIWRLEQFHLHPGPDWTQSQIWLRARSGAIAKVFTVEVDLSGSADDYDFETTWRDGWTVVNAGVLTSESLRSCDDFPGDLEITSDTPSTPSERWLSFLFHPARFSTPSIEAALHIYRTARGLTTSRGGASLVHQSLQERLVWALSSKILLRTLPDKTPDYDHYNSDIRAQWQAFYSLLSHLHSRRHDSIHLAFDVESGLAWTVCADFVAPIRRLDDVELRQENAWLLQDPADGNSAQPLYEDIFPPDDDVFIGSKIMAAAKDFRRSFSASSRLRVEDAAVHDAMLNDDSADSAQRVHTLFERCGLDVEVTDEDFDALNDAVEAIGGLGSLQTDQLLIPLEWLDCNVHGVIEQRVEPGHFGALVNIAIARETLEQSRSTLLDLLVLVVFMAGGLEEAELEANFRAGEIYDAIISRLRHNELLVWLATHSVHERSDSAPDRAGSTTTLFEDLFAGDWHAYKLPNAKSQERSTITMESHMPEALTLCNKIWVSGPDVSNNWSDITASTLARLLKKDRLDLAVDFQRFLPGDPWCSYLQARLHVATGEYALAGIHFQAASTDLAEWKGISTAGGASFLQPDEQQHIGHGISSYFQHVTAVFEKVKAYSFVADFAKLALQDLHVTDFTRSIADIDRKKSQKETPAKDKATLIQREAALLKLKETHAEILLRQFNALKETGRYAQAFEALEKVENPAPRRSELKKLVEACVKQDDLSILLGVPLASDMAEDVDAIMSQLAKAELSGSLTSKHTPYYQILYSFRVKRGNFRGAAEIVYDHLQRLQSSDSYAVQNPEDETVTQMYVLLINTLACCGEEDAWILATGSIPQGGKRRLVTLADVRREYAMELDKRSDILQGRFPLIGNGDEMDVL